MINKVGGYISQNCRAACTPLSRCECSNSYSHINQQLNQWYFMNLQKAKLQMQQKRTAKAAPVQKFTMNFMPDYAATTTKTEVETPSIVDPLGRQPYKTITTDEHKRISPEFLQLLMQNETNIKSREDAQPQLVNAVNSPNVAAATPSPAYPQDQMHPKFAKYLSDAMERDDIFNKIYGINFYKRDDEPSTKHTSTNPYQFLAVDQLSHIGDTLMNGERLSNEQLMYLINFLQNAALLNVEQLGHLMHMLNGMNLLNSEIMNFMHKLLMLTGGNLRDEQLILLMGMFENYKPTARRPTTKKSKKDGVAALTASAQSTPDKKSTLATVNSLEMDDVKAAVSAHYKRRSDDLNQRPETHKTKSRSVGYILGQQSTDQNSYQSLQQSNRGSISLRRKTRQSRQRRQTRQESDYDDYGSLNQQSADSFIFRKTVDNDDYRPTRFGKRPTRPTVDDDFRIEHRPSRRSSIPTTGYIKPHYVSDDGKSIVEVNVNENRPNFPDYYNSRTDLLKRISQAAPKKMHDDMPVQTRRIRSESKSSFTEGRKSKRLSRRRLPSFLNPISRRVSKAHLERKMLGSSKWQGRDKSSIA